MKEKPGLINSGKMNSSLLLNSRLPEERTLVYQKLRFGGTELSCSYVPAALRGTGLLSTTELLSTMFGKSRQEFSTLVDKNSVMLKTKLK